MHIGGRRRAVDGTAREGGDINTAIGAGRGFGHAARQGDDLSLAKRDARINAVVAGQFVAVGPHARGHIRQRITPARDGDLVIGVSNHAPRIGFGSVCKRAARGLGS